MPLTHERKTSLSSEGLYLDQPIEHANTTPRGAGVQTATDGGHTTNGVSKHGRAERINKIRRKYEDPETMSVALDKALDILLRDLQHEPNEY